MKLTFVKSIFILFAILLFVSCKNKNEAASEAPQVSVSDTTTIFSTATFILKDSKIPESIFGLTDLRVLRIQGMNCDVKSAEVQCWTIGEIPTQIKNLSNLEELYLNVNSIQKLPKEIGDLKKIRIVDLSDNPGLDNIDILTTLPELEEIHIFGCGLKKLPADIAKLKKLKYLGLAGNKIGEDDFERIENELPDCEIVF